MHLGRAPSGWRGRTVYSARQEPGLFADPPVSARPGARPTSVTPQFGPFEEPLADRYRFEAELGRGGMGTVYRARDLRLERLVAIKVLHPALTTEVGVARFQFEIRIAAGLRHAHIVAVHDSGEAAGYLYYVMDFVDGETLRARIKREKQMGVDDSLKIIGEVAEGLQYAHDHSVVHRDVKPENIILSDGHACVVDFGLARALDSVDEHRLTASGLAVGTPHYLSPEQAAAEKDVGPKADQYALACVLYEMLAGEPPFTGPTASAIAMRHLTEVPVRIARRRRNVTRSIDESVARALEKVPADRFVSMRDFCHSTRASDWTRLTWWTRTRGVSVSTARIAGAVVTAALIVFIPFASPVDNPSRIAHSGWGYAKAWLTKSATLDSNLIAIAPFFVVGADSLWREGLIDLIHPTFDGAGPLRSLSTRQVLRISKEVRDADAAIALGRTAGAGLVLFGRLSASGADSVGLRVTLLDVGTRSVIGDVDINGRTDQVGRLADSVSVRLMRDLGAVRPIGAVRTTSISSRSVSALKAFLRGEQLYRNNQWIQAEAFYLQAIRDDDGYAQAFHRLRGVLRGTRGEDDALSFKYALQAGALNHGLSARDSLLIAADSLHAAMTLAPGGQLWLPMLQRRVAILRQSVETYPQDPEGWLELGEAQLHYRDWIGADISETLRSFRSAIQQDSAFAPAYFHAIELSARVEGAAATHALATKYVSLRPDDVAVRLVRDVVSTSRDSASRAVAALDSIAPMKALPLAYLLRFLGDSAEVALRVFDSFDRATHTSVLSRRDSLRIERWRFRTLAIRGHLSAAYARAGDAVAAWTPADYVRLAQAGIVPPVQANRVLRKWVDTAGAARTVLSLSWWAQQRDSATISALQRRFQRQTQEARSPRERDMASYSLAVTRAYLAIVRRDTSAALRAFAVTPESYCGGDCTMHRLQHSSLLRARNRPSDAQRLLERYPPTAEYASLLEIEWMEEHSLAARAAGHLEAAAADAAMLARLRRNAGGAGARVAHLP